MRSPRLGRGACQLRELIEAGRHLVEQEGVDAPECWIRCHPTTCSAWQTLRPRSDALRRRAPAAASAPSGSPYLRSEAVAAPRIEGTQASLFNVFDFDWWLALFLDRVRVQATDAVVRAEPLRQLADLEILTEMSGRPRGQLRWRAQQIPRAARGLVSRWRPAVVLLGRPPGRNPHLIGVGSMSC